MSYRESRGGRRAYGNDVGGGGAGGPKFIGGAQRARLAARKRPRDGGGGGRRGGGGAKRGRGGGGGGSGAGVGGGGVVGGGGGPAPRLPKKMRPRDRFFASVLSCSASDLGRSNSDESVRARVLGDMCGMVGVPPPSRLTASSRDAAHFYSARASLVLEESRCVLSEALGGGRGRGGGGGGGPGGPLRLWLASVKDDDRAKCKVLSFRKAGRAGGEDPPPFLPREMFDMRPGCCFEIVLPRGRRGDVSGDGGGGGGGGGGAPSERSVLATVLPRGSGGGGESSGTLSLMVFRPLDLGGSEGADAPWEVRPLATLISEARQFEACDRVSRVPFLPKIMGWRDGTHTRFPDSDEDDDDDEDDDGGEEKKVEDEDDEDDDDDNDVCGDSEGSGCSENAAAYAPAARFDLPALNPTQERAANAFLDSPSSTVTLVQGPPGTGKTTFMVSVLCRCLSLSYPRRRILVAAPTNRAVSVLASRFLDALPRDCDRFNVVLIGVEDKLLPPDDGGGCGSADGGGSSSSSSDDPPLSSSLQGIFVYTWMETTIDAYRSLRDGVRAGRRGRGGGIGGMAAEARRLRRRLEGGIPGLCRKVGASAPAREVASCLEEGAAAAPAASASGDGPEAELLRRLSEAGTSLDSLIPALESIDPSSAVRELLATADVIFSTLSSAGVAAMKSTRGVDDLFVDEAAAATEPEVCVPFHLRPERMLAVGDPMQLPATVMSRHAADMGLDKSLHERLMFGCGREHIMLDVQYRMRPEICAFPSRQFYGGTLRNGDNVLGPNYYAECTSLGGKPYRFLQVKGREQRSHGGSFYNPEEAKAIVRIVRRVRDGSRPASDGGTPTPWDSPDRIRIITFYQGQVSYLRGLLRRSGLGGVLVATVDSSQGCEADSVIVSFVRSNGGRGGDARRAAGFLTDDRRINVALTRARHRLVCVGDAMGTLNAAGAETLNALAEDAGARGCVSAVAGG